MVFFSYMKLQKKLKSKSINFLSLHVLVNFLDAEVGLGGACIGLFNVLLIQLVCGLSSNFFIPVF